MIRITHFCSIGTLDVGSPVSTLKTVLLMARDYQVSVVLPEEGAFSEELRMHGIEVVIIPFPRLRRFRKISEWLDYLFGTLSAGLKLRRWLKRENIGLVHFSDLIDAPYMFFARLAGCKVVTHVRVILLKEWAKIVYRWICSLTADRVLCVSEATRKAMFPKASPRVHLLYDPGPSDCFLTEPVQEPEGELKILAVGKFLQVKGHANLIELAHRLKSRGIDFHVTIVGKVQPGHEEYHEKCRALMEEYQLTHSFEIIPFLSPEELSRKMDEVHVLAHLPNYQEPFPGVTLEAMARGRVVVAFDSGGIREQFEDGRSGFLIKHGDLDSACEVLLRLAGSPELRQQIGREARECVTRHFNAQKHRRELLAIYASDFTPKISASSPSLR